MSQAIQEIFKNLFNNNVLLATILISMLPIIELRGGIPFAMSKDLWGELALSNWKAFAFSFLGSCLVVPILALLFLPIINWLKKTKAFKKFALWVENLIKSKSKKVMDDGDNQTSNEDIVENEKDNVLTSKNETNDIKKDLSKMLGVFLFVAIPLPLTGVWTGTAIAVMLGLSFWKTCLSVIVGNFVAGIIMLTLCTIFPNFTTWILVIFLALTAILIVGGLIKNKLHKKSE